MEKLFNLLVAASSMKPDFHYPELDISARGNRVKKLSEHPRKKGPGRGKQHRFAGFFSGTKLARKMESGINTHACRTRHKK